MMPNTTGRASHMGYEKATWGIRTPDLYCINRFLCWIYLPGETRGGTQAGTVALSKAIDDPQLRQLIDAWPSLPDEAKRAILALVQSYQQREP
jgi:hypothetical protein